MNIGAPRVVARSTYLEQVRRIAPPDPPGLVGREAEIAELAAFCLEPDRGPYAWWQAGAWAGKSALMSAFVLRPPAEVSERARIVSFFITARLAAQDTADAFTQALAEQLASLTGQDIPATLPEATRDAYLLDLLAHAADSCQAEGGRLVLVVDGLDEDRGVTTGPGSHSIAGLLPADPPYGMRLIVAGRPNPPIPDDVPDWHPLRDPAIVRPLEGSPYAQDVQRLSRHELQRLLHGTTIEQDLLGLVTAARGGLSAKDLEELTGTAVWDVEQILHTTAGRTFARRPSQREGSAGPDVYLLGHEELQVAATGYLGQRLNGYRDRLHEWADRYRAEGWPDRTPEYLMLGYYRLLTAVSDLDRMIACAGDPDRHEQMLLVTGGDAAALTEIAVALNLIAAQENPDLASALYLAWHRDALIDRNSNIPGKLPAIWATLGNLTRAEALATSLSGISQALALAHVAVALSKAGHHGRAFAVASQAEAAARSSNEPYWRAASLAEVAVLLTVAGQHEQAALLREQAEARARLTGHPDRQADAFTGAADALADAGQDEYAVAFARKAEAAAHSITDPFEHVLALANVAHVLAKAGQPEQAATVAGTTETMARSITNPRQRARALAEAAHALARAGQRERAVTVASSAEAAARSIAGPEDEAPMMAKVVGALGLTGQAEQAEALARSLVTEQGLSSLASALVETGDLKRAEAAARSVTDPYEQAEALGEVAEALAQAGQLREAEAAARSIAEEYWQSSALAAVTAAMARAGQFEQAEAIASSITFEYHQAEALTLVAEALAEAGQTQRATTVAAQAEATARSVVGRETQASVLTMIAGALSKAGQRRQATAVAKQADAMTRSITDPGSKARAIAEVAEALAHAGQVSEAQVTAAAVTEPYWQAYALAQIGNALSDAGQSRQAAASARRAVETARSIADPGDQAQALLTAATALA